MLLSTGLGLMPCAMGIGPGAEIQAALARVVVGGLVASTPATLFLIPTTYVTATTAVERLRGRSRSEREVADPLPADKPVIPA